MANRFDSYMRGAKLARILADEAFLEYKKGNDRKALGHIIASVRQFITATNNVAHLKFNPRKKNPLAPKRAKPAPAVPAVKWDSNEEAHQRVAKNFGGHE